MRSTTARGALATLAFMSILFTLSGLPQKGLNYWYLFFSPMVLAASFFGVRGAVVTSGAALAAVLLLYQRTSAAMGEYVAAAGVPVAALAEPPFETYTHAFAGMALMALGAVATGLLTDRRPLLGEGTRVPDQAQRLAPDGFRRWLAGLARQAGRRDAAGAVLLAHFPGFTRLSHDLGPSATDQLFEQIEARLQASLRADDALCRMEAGELAIALHGAGRPQAEAIARRLQQALAAAPIGVEGRTEVLTANIGVALCPADATDADTLMECAKEALHHAHTEQGLYFYRPVTLRMLPQ